MERARVVAVLKLRLGDRRLERDVPERGRLGPVRLAPGEVVQERPLRHPPRVVTDRGVEQRPVHGEADAPPHVLEGALVDLGEPLAQLDEVAPGDRYLALAAPSPAARTKGRTAPTGRSARRRRSAPAARSAARCRPSRAGRRPPCRSSAGSGPRCPRGCRKTRARRAATRTRWAAACQWSTPTHAAWTGRTGIPGRPPSVRSIPPQVRRERACRGRWQRVAGRHRSCTNCTERRGASLVIYLGPLVSIP